MSKLTLLVGFGAGYVLGSRAGRQRYEQIARAARRLKDHPTVQSTAGILGAQASGLANRARGKAMDALHMGHDEPPTYARASANGAMP
jgi:hypothetical protein